MSHTHEFKGHAYGHDHKDGDDPHGHTKAEHEDELEDELDEEEPDGGDDKKGDDKSPGVSKKKPDEKGGKAGDDEPAPTDDGDDDAEEEEVAEEATPVSVPTQADGPEQHERPSYSDNAFHSRRGR